MAYIPEEKIQDIKDQLDIVNIISDYIELKPSGQNYIGLCPFHNEKTPSFTVSRSKGIFHCFGCGVGGDAITFIMKKENMNYVEAIHFLADKLGIFLDTGNVDKELYEHRKTLLRINEEAKYYFFQQLLTYQLPKEYLSNRGLDKSVVNKFMLGYAPDGFDNLLNYFKGKNVKTEDLLELGLIKKSANGHLYDAYRNRLIFPITNNRKEVIGFGGRTLVDDRAKYINSPESIVYHKSKNLYGVTNFNSISKKDKVVIVEGYVDVISLYNYGIDYCVASLGTALTKEQAKLISRYTKNIYLCYDGDSAGQSATQRAIEIFKEIDIQANVIELPEQLDPDDYIKKYGKESFETLITNSLNSILYNYTKLLKNYDLDDINSKTEFLNELVKMLNEIDNKLIQDEYLIRFSKDLDINIDSIKSELSKQKSYSKTPVKDTPKVNRVNNNKLIFLESIKYYLFNNDIEFRSKILNSGNFLEEETEYFTPTIIFIEENGLTIDTTLDDIKELDGNSNIKKIIETTLKTQNRDYYNNKENAIRFLNSLKRHVLIMERDKLKEQLILLQENEELSESLKKSYTDLANEIFKINSLLKSI
ncbi:DNA primase [Mediannikoviicoccus vaginalis]|uniref:DNA primase n=1 Tax=Mediannikoviicoccus vaginalis TaxID=2899727 RepID=UPI001EFF9B52|nr:DNA primase [Mediannikoviicoccus vaginalis]